MAQAQQFRVLNEQEAISEVALEFIAPPHTQIEDEGENAARHAPERTLFGHYFKQAEQLPRSPSEGAGV